MKVTQGKAQLGVGLVFTSEDKWGGTETKKATQDEQHRKEPSMYFLVDPRKKVK